VDEMLLASRFSLLDCEQYYLLECEEYILVAVYLRFGGTYSMLVTFSCNSPLKIEKL
jgi:hypothetical protein